MLEYERDSRVAASAWFGELRRLTSPDLDDVIPPLIEKRPHRRHIGPHKTRLLSANLRLRLQLIRDGMEREFEQYGI